MSVTEKLAELENKIWRIEKIVWYLATLLSVKTGVEAFPIVSAYFGKV